MAVYFELVNPTIKTAFQKNKNQEDQKGGLFFYG
jgi:hypothetical protein